MVMEELSGGWGGVGLGQIGMAEWQNPNKNVPLLGLPWKFTPSYTWAVIPGRKD